MNEVCLHLHIENVWENCDTAKTLSGPLSVRFILNPYPDLTLLGYKNQRAPLHFTFPLQRQVAIEDVSKEKDN